MDSRLPALVHVAGACRICYLKLGSLSFYAKARRLKRLLNRAASCGDRFTTARVGAFTFSHLLAAWEKKMHRLIAVVLGLGMLAGCDRSKPAPSKEMVKATEPAKASNNDVLVSQALSPKSTIQECLSAYGRLRSYQDNAYVALRYDSNGQTYRDRAPVRIAWERDGQIGFQVYSVRAGPGENRWRLRIDREDLADPNQVLSRAKPKQVDFSWLLADSVVSQSLSAGLAGFPPQFDLLLSEKPLSGLINASAQLAFRSSEQIDGRACHVIDVTRQRLTYRLFIDKASMMLRRMKLPAENLPAEIRDNINVTKLSLCIEFEGIQTNRAVDWAEFEVDTKASDLMINHFVAVPPTTNVDVLGIKVPAFELRDASGAIAFRALSQNSSDQKIRVLVWLADHPTSEVASEQLRQAWEIWQTIPEFKGRVELIPIWAEPKPPKGETFATLKQRQEFASVLALDNRALGRDLFSIEEAPSVVILDGQNRVQRVESGVNPVLGQLLTDSLQRLLDGEDLAIQQIAQARDLNRRYEAELRRALTLDRKLDRRTIALSRYSPQFFDLNALETVETGGEVVLAVNGPNQRLWELNRDGRLTVREPRSPKVELEFHPEWTLTDDAEMLVAPGARFIAYASSAKKTVQIFDLETQRNQTVSLRIEAPPNQFTWLALHGSDVPRLAAITANNELLLLDPANHEQLSGRCPTAPVAFLTKPDQSGTVQGQIVLADGRIESLRLDPQSTHQALPLLGRKAAFSSGPSSEEKKLAFEPDFGPWVTWRNDEKARTLARGWLAKDEPAVFMLGDDLRPMWHFRTPLSHGAGAPIRASVTQDPATGLAIWAFCDAEQTIYILREDAVVDHFRVRDDFVGLGMHRSGSDLLLNIVFPNRSETYSIKWK